MDENTARETVRFIAAIAEETGAREVSIIFHGGEPLLASVSIWEILLNGLSERFGRANLRLSLQSNLWNLTDAHLALFIRYGVKLGTSLDGPREICDLNRGNGYFSRTMAGIRKAQQAGKPVSVITTITRRTMPFAHRILAFLIEEGFPAALHAAIAPIAHQDHAYALSSDEYADLIIGLFPDYVETRGLSRLDPFDHYVRGIALGNPGICAFRDCFGRFLAIAPSGDVTGCQRFAGLRQYRMGNIFQRPTLTKLLRSPAAQRWGERRERVKALCGACEFYSICKGGCPYSAAAAGQDIDPFCDATKRIYTFVQDRLIEEMASSENMAEVLANPTVRGVNPLLRKGRYISLAYEAEE